MKRGSAHPFVLSLVVHSQARLIVERLPGGTRRLATHPPHASIGTFGCRTSLNGGAA
jgi:hypothetical protein